MDNDGNRTLEYDDFRWGLKNIGICYNNQEVKELFCHFDQNGNGSVDFAEFMNTIRVRPSLFSLVMLTITFLGSH